MILVHELLRNNFIAVSRRVATFLALVGQTKRAENKTKQSNLVYILVNPREACENLSF